MLAFLYFVVFITLGAKTKARLALYARRDESMSRLKRDKLQAQEECQAHKRKYVELEEEKARLEKKVTNKKVCI